MDWGLVAWVVGTALVIAAGVPTVFFYRSEWSWAEQDAVGRRRILGTALRTGPLFGVTCGVFGAIVAAVTSIGWLSAAAMVLVAAGLTLWSLRVSAPMNELHRLGRQLDDPARRQHARARVLAIVEAAPEDGVGKTFRLAAATVLSNGFLHQDALRILQSIPEEGLDTHDRELHALGLLDCLIQLRELPSARAALEKVPVVEPGGVHASSRANMEALLLVLEGKPDEALRCIATPAGHPKSEKGRHSVLAHAHAARGDDENRHACLLWLREHHGTTALQHVVDQNGPASWYARELLNEGAAPYRT